jgi:hypothetical protein
LHSNRFNYCIAILFIILKLQCNYFSFSLGPLYFLWLIVEPIL